MAPNINLSRIKEVREQIIILSLLSVQELLVSARNGNSYNNFRILTADILLDENGKPWLNEFNTAATLTALRKHNEIQQVLNILGYHLPNELQEPPWDINYNNASSFLEELYKFPTNVTYKMKKILTMFQNKSQSMKIINKEILNYLEFDEIKQLIIAEDEFARVNNNNETNFIRLTKTISTKTLNMYYNNVEYSYNTIITYIILSFII